MCEIPHIYIYVYIFSWISHIFVYIFIYIYMCVCVFVCVCVCEIHQIYIFFLEFHTYLCVYIYICVCVCVCVEFMKCIYTHFYIYIFGEFHTHIYIYIYVCVCIYKWKLLPRRKLMAFHFPSCINGYILYGAGDGQLCLTEEYFACLKRHKEKRNFFRKVDLLPSLCIKTTGHLDYWTPRNCELFIPKGPSQFLSHVLFTSVINCGFKNLPFPLPLVTLSELTIGAKNNVVLNEVYFCLQK